ncbi:hypothetical protein [Aquimarina algicola]|uniref:Anti-sigma factor n=1 Tax=Aquimarina algicola TaxID=2589995 RepID=A0A504J247_9FLAO|nr:hypothetical protein [Aquimarina algicola]TPN82078.1 hypothetical protein FHK87_21870 [Aquimarina algicola]
MDDLEKYIIDNKNKFEEHNPDVSKIWSAIESQLPDQKKYKIYNLAWFKVAASILIIIGTFSIMSRINTIKTTQNQTNPIVQQELRDIDTYYKDLVAFQVKLVENNPKLQPEEKEKFLSFMKELDIEHEILKQEMNKNLNNEYILEAIVNNYKKRIELIENLLEQINNSKKSYHNEGYVL